MSQKESRMTRLLLFIKSIAFKRSVAVAVACLLLAGGVLGAVRLGRYLQDGGAAGLMAEDFEQPSAQADETEDAPSETISSEPSIEPSAELEPTAAAIIEPAPLVSVERANINGFIVTLDSVEHEDTVTTFSITLTAPMGTVIPPGYNIDFERYWVLDGDGNVLIEQDSALHTYIYGVEMRNDSTKAESSVSGTITITNEELHKVESVQLVLENMTIFQMITANSGFNISQYLRENPELNDQSVVFGETYYYSNQLLYDEPDIPNKGLGLRLFDDGDFTIENITKQDQFVLFRVDLGTSGSGMFIPIFQCSINGKPVNHALGGHAVYDDKRNFTCQYAAFDDDLIVDSVYYRAACIYATGQMKTNMSITNISKRESLYRYVLEGYDFVVYPNKMVIPDSGKLNQTALSQSGRAFCGIESYTKNGENMYGIGYFDQRNEQLTIFSDYAGFEDLGAILYCIYRSDGTVHYTIITGFGDETLSLYETTDESEMLRRIGAA